MLHVEALISVSSFITFFFYVRHEVVTPAFVHQIVPAHGVTPTVKSVLSVGVNIFHFDE